MSDDLTDFTENVRAWAESIPEIKSVILFGSRARGDNRPDSDWDIYIHGEDANTTWAAWYGDWVALADSWKESFCVAVNLDKSDVQFVTNTSNQVREGIKRSSKVIYER